MFFGDVLFGSQELTSAALLGSLTVLCLGPWLFVPAPRHRTGEGDEGDEGDGGDGGDGGDEGDEGDEGEGAKAEANGRSPVRKSESQKVRKRVSTPSTSVRFPTDSRPERSEAVLLGDWMAEGREESNWCAPQDS